MNMRSLISLLLLPIACVFAVAQQTPQRGVYVQDLDRKTDPCTDFYEYANGSWRAQNPIPATMSRWSRRWAAGETNKEQVKGILEEISSRTDWPKGSVEQLTGDYYASCMQQSQIDKIGITPIQPMLAEIDAMNSPADVQRMIGKFHQLQIPVPFGLTAQPDNHDPNQIIANIFAGGLGLPDRDYYLKTEERFKDTRAKYLVHVANMFELAGATKDDARPAAKRIMEFETRLAEASLDNVALRDPAATDHKTKFEDLGKLTPHFDWNGYFSTERLPKADLNVDQPKFLREIDHQLSDASVGQWKLYLRWHLLNAAAPYLSSPFVNEDFDFNGKYLSGAAELKPRWKRCVEAADASLGDAVGQKYVEKYFPPAAKARMLDMVRNLRLALKQTVEGLDWMSPATKAKALEKLSTFNPKIGYPDKWKDYSKVEIRRDSFWANVVAGTRFNLEDDWSQIGKPADKSRWGITPPTSDAYYNPLWNEIVFPAGILQPPAFSMDAVDAVNYGAIGVVIGHEISHGFDDQGAQYDAQGRLQNWWTPEDLKRFQERGQCVVSQFDSYFIEPNIHHNGKLVLGEAIGDLAGAKLAYLAFKISQQDKPSAPVIDGFTPDQQFFVAWGQFRGDATRPETQRLMVQTDPHPIAKYRVVGPLSNLPAFQQAFGCKADAAMVRPAGKRCEVW
jgi:putative endopeptidase